MTKQSTEAVAASSPTWETLEAFARHGMQQFLQRVLEAEVDELLARGWYERRAAVDAPGGYRNGFGKPRRLSLSNGTISLRRPRVRGLSERFESRPRKVAALEPQLLQERARCGCEFEEPEGHAPAPPPHDMRPPGKGRLKRGFTCGPGSVSAPCFGAA